LFDGEQQYYLEPKHFYLWDNMKWKHRSHPRYNRMKEGRKFFRVFIVPK
jgi:hypothetical protein